MVNAIKKLCKVCLVTTMVLTPSSVLAQNVVKGTVLDANNEPVIGASVIEKGNPKNGTVTDIDGNFTLNLKAGKTAVISYIGMVAQEVKVGGQAQTIVLKDDNSQLNEVVVVGYTSKARKDLTGSVGSISGQKLAVVPVASAAEALELTIGIEVNLHLTSLCRFSSNDNYTITTSSTINSGEGSILQYIDALNIGRRDVVDVVSLESIDDKQRFRVLGT